LNVVLANAPPSPPGPSHRRRTLTGARRATRTCAGPIRSPSRFFRFLSGTPPMSLVESWAIFFFRKRPSSSSHLLFLASPPKPSSRFMLGRFTAPSQVFVLLCSSPKVDFLKNVRIPALARCEFRFLVRVSAFFHELRIPAARRDTHRCNRPTHNTRRRALAFVQR